MKTNIIKTTGLVLSVLIIISGALVLTGCEDTLIPFIEEEVRLAELDGYELTILDPTVGTVTPTGAFVLKEGEPMDIAAYPPVDYSFVRWEQVDGSGTANFEDDLSSSTTVNLTGGHASVQAVLNDEVSPTGSVSIQNKINISGTDYRNSRTIDTLLTYSDNSGSVSEMKLSYLSFGTGTTTGWQTVDQGPQYTFNSDGAKTLYLRFRDADGNESALYTDTIYIDSTAPVPSSTKVELIANPGSYPLYVTVYGDTDLQLSYQASDAGSGVQKVYFSNNTTRPAVAQVQNFTFPTVPYPWALTTYSLNFGYYTVSFWFEDKLGNISGRYAANVRYDDNYERTSGNNTMDAVSGATIDMDPNYGLDYDTQYRLYTVHNPDRGYARLVDEDYYKWGFNALDSNNTYPATFILYVNNASSTYTQTPEVTFYDHNRNVVSYTYTYPYSSNSQVRYTLEMPYIYTGDPQQAPAFYYFYMRVRKRYATVTPYSTNWNYDIYWTFTEDQGM